MVQIAVSLIGDWCSCCCGHNVDVVVVVAAISEVISPLDSGSWCGFCHQCFQMPTPSHLTATKEQGNNRGTMWVPMKMETLSEIKTLSSFYQVHGRGSRSHL